MPRTGFTLIELVMVLALLVVIASLTIPGILRWQNRFPMEQAIATTQQQCQETRLTAIRTGEAWALTIPDSAHQGRCNAVHDVNRTGDEFQLPGGIQCREVSRDGRDSSRGRNEDSRIQIIFQADGTSSDRTLSLVDSSGNETTLQLDRLTGSLSVVPTTTLHNGK